MFTEFYCDPAAGSNLNSGSTEGGATTYSAAGGGWDSATGVFTPASGDPSASVSVGQFASIFLDAATVAVFVARVTAVSATTITVSLAAKSGTAPATAATGLSCRVGGAWKGPNAAQGFPFGFAAAAMSDAAGSTPRVNLKNNAAYAITAATTHSLAGPITIQGYTTTPGDGGRAVIDGGAVGSSYTLFTSGGLHHHIRDLIFQNNGATGGNWGITLASSGGEGVAERVTVRDVRGGGIQVSGAGALLVECEVARFNQAGSGAGLLASGIFNNGSLSSPYAYDRCVVHDGGGAAAGYYISGGATLDSCIADKCGGPGYQYVGGTTVRMRGCDAHNNGGDGLSFAPASVASARVESCNFVLNGGYGVAVASTGSLVVVRTCGFRLNTSGQTSGPITVEEGSIAYAASPYADAGTGAAPRAGNFTIALPAAQGVGRGAFTQDPSSYSSATTAYCDIGAAQHQGPTPASVAEAMWLYGDRTTTG